MLLLTVTCLVLGAALAKPQPRAVAVSGNEPALLPDSVDRAFNNLEPGTYSLGPGTYSFISPNYPNMYDNDDRYKWTLRGTEGQRITVQCDPFDVEYESDCWFDFLKINGVKYCGNDQVPAIRRRRFWIVFKTDSSVKATGFYCTVTVPGDGGSTEATTAGTTEATTAGTTAGTTEATTAGTTQAPGDQCCGRANRATRIVGGVQTEVNEYPWQAAVLNTDNDVPWCGGTVINNQWVMTAAHCMARESAGNLQVLLRKHRLGSDSSLRMNVAQIVTHPSYNSRNMTHDFSLLKLSETIDFGSLSNKVAPACLPSGGDFVNVDAIVSGWGTTSSGGSQPSALREVTVQTMSNAECINDLGARMIDATMICADVDAGGKDSCQGDSGGPLVTDVSGRYTLIGVVSWGYGCAVRGSPGVYSRMTAVSDWIDETTDGASLC